MADLFKAFFQRILFSIGKTYSVFSQHVKWAWGICKQVSIFNANCRLSVFFVFNIVMGSLPMHLSGLSCLLLLLLLLLSVLCAYI